MDFINQFAQMQNERRKYEDPSVAERVVAHMQRTAAMPDKLAKIPIGSDLAKVTTAIPRDDPRHDIGNKMMGNYDKVLAAYPGNHPIDVLNAYHNKMLSEVAEDTYKYIRKDRTGGMNILRNMVHAKPIQSVANMPGYEEWESKTKRDEAANPAHMMGPVGYASWIGGGTLAKSLAAKGVGGGLLRAAARLLPGVAAGELAAGPAGWAALGVEAAAWAGMDLAWTAIENSDWARARTTGPWYVPDITTVPKLLAGMGAMKGVEKGLQKGIGPLLRKGSDMLLDSVAAKGALDEATSAVAKDPSVKKILDFSEKGAIFAKTSSHYGPDMAEQVRRIATVIGGESLGVTGTEAARSQGALREVANFMVGHTETLRAGVYAQLRTAIEENPEIRSHELMNLVENKGIPVDEAVNQLKNIAASQHLDRRLKGEISFDKSYNEAVERKVAEGNKRVDVFKKTYDDFYGPERAVTEVKPGAEMVPMERAGAPALKRGGTEVALTPEPITITSRNVPPKPPSGKQLTLLSKSGVDIEGARRAWTDIHGEPIEAKGITEEIKTPVETYKAPETHEDRLLKRTELLTSQQEITDRISETIGRKEVVPEVAAEVPIIEKPSKIDVISKGVKKGDQISFNDPQHGWIPLKVTRGTDKEGKIVLGKGTAARVLTTEDLKNTEMYRYLGPEKQSALELSSKEAAAYDKEHGTGSNLKSIAGIGIGIGALATIGSMLNTKEAEASPLSEALGKGLGAVAKGFEKGVVHPEVINGLAEVSGKSKVELLRDIVKAGMYGHEIDPLNPKVLPLKWNVASFHDGAMKRLTDYGKSKAGFLQRFWSPNIVAEHVYGGMIKDAVTGEAKRNFAGPEAELAMRTHAAFWDSNKGKEVLQNNVKDIPNYRDNSRELAQLTKPIVDAGYYEKTMLAGGYGSRINALDKAFKDLSKKLPKLEGIEKDESLAMIDLMKAQQKKYVDLMNPLRADIDVLDKQMTEINKGLVKRPEFASTRIELASRGEGMGEGADGWLTPHLTEDEKVATGYIRKAYDEMMMRADEVGIGRTIKSEPYGHFPPHPKADFAAMSKEAEKKFRESLMDIEGKSFEDVLPDHMGGLPMAKLMSRSFGAFQIMPEMNYVWNHYMPDINQRLQYGEFWKNWTPHIEQVRKMGYDAANQYWDSVKRSFKPYERTPFNTLMRNMYSFEAAIRLALMPGTSLKHAMKQEANLAMFGGKEYVKSFPVALAAQFKSVAGKVAKEYGMSDKESELYGQILKSWSHQDRLISTVLDIGPEEPINFAENFLHKFTEKGSVLIRAAEQFDRGLSFVGAFSMAAKKGMTAADATYGIMDTMLKNNFFSGKHNPEWLRNPKVRMMMMFQGTPFKILEQRILLAERGGKAINRAKIELLRQLSGDIKEGETQFKWGMIKDALESEKDIYGTPNAYQLMKKILVIGTAITAGAKILNIDLTPGLIHIPGVELGKTGVELNFNPVTQAALRARQHGDDEYYISSFFTKWLPSGPVPSILTKVNKLNNGDIPERYGGSWLRSLFSIPVAYKD